MTQAFKRSSTQACQRAITHQARPSGSRTSDGCAGLPHPRAARDASALSEVFPDYNGSGAREQGSGGDRPAGGNAQERGAHHAQRPRMGECGAPHPHAPPVPVSKTLEIETVRSPEQQERRALTVRAMRAQRPSDAPSLSLDPAPPSRPARERLTRTVVAGVIVVVGIVAVVAALSSPGGEQRRTPTATTVAERGVAPKSTKPQPLAIQPARPVLPVETARPAAPSTLSTPTAPAAPSSPPLTTSALTASPPKTPTTRPRASAPAPKLSQPAPVSEPKYRPPHQPEF
jgi:hypothetical protein